MQHELAQRIFRGKPAALLYRLKLGDIMLDLIFLVLMIIVLVQANNGKVNAVLCDVALVIGIFAGVIGLMNAFFIRGESLLWVLNIVIMLMGLFLRKVACRFADLHNQRIDEYQEKYREWKERRSSDNGREIHSDINFDDPEVRFNGSFNENKDV